MTFFFFSETLNIKTSSEKILHHHVNFVDFFKLYYILTLGVQFRYLDHSSPWYGIQLF